MSQEMDFRYWHMRAWVDNARSYSLECGGQSTEADDVLQSKDFGSGEVPEGKPVFSFLEDEHANSDKEPSSSSSGRMALF